MLLTWLDKAGRGRDELSSHINDPKSSVSPGAANGGYCAEDGRILFILVKKHSVSLFGKDRRKPEHLAILRVGDSCGGLPGTVQENHWRKTC